MGSENQVFQVETETGEIVDAELLAVVEIDGQEYAVYSIDNGDDSVDILASYVVKDEEGYDKLADIKDPADKEKIQNYIKSLISDKIEIPDTITGTITEMLRDIQ